MVVNILTRFEQEYCVFSSDNKNLEQQAEQAQNPSVSGCSSS